MAHFGAGGDDDGYGSQVPSRAVAVYQDDATGVTVIAERHTGSTGPPGREETHLLRGAIQPYI